MPIRIQSALRRLAIILAIALVPWPAHSAGSIPVALSQQMDSNGKPLVGALLYLYVVGTVAQPQLAFQDTGLTLPLPWPVVADGNGRLPMFYLADGSVHARLTDSGGSVQFDYPSMLVIGPSGGGGGGSSVDPSTIFSTGDVKFRPTGETLTGWVKMNGLTIGSALSGASGRANADAQALFVYLWQNCPDAHCPVLSGRGGSALADFNANKQLTVPDWRARIPVGMDCMGAPCAGRILAGNVTSGGGDGVDTAQATGGEANHTLLTAEIPAHSHTSTAHSHSGTVGVGINGSFLAGAPAAGQGNLIGVQSDGVNVAVGSTAVTTNNTGGGGLHNVMNPFMLGTWYMRL